MMSRGHRVGGVWRHGMKKDTEGESVMAGSDDPPRFQTGMAVRRRVLGDAHVDRANAAMTDFDQPFQALITESAWGTVWSRPQLTHRERSLITIAVLGALGHHEELAMHVRATANTGASAHDIREALLHVAIYAGVPAANAAFKIAKSVLSEGHGGTTPRDPD